MFVTRDKNRAADVAAEQNTYFGFCEKDGCYYVGHPAELERVGVQEVKKPRNSR